MTLNRPLWRWQVRQIRGMTVLGLVVALIYTVAEPDVLQFGAASPAAYFIGLHCLWIAWRLGRTEHPGFGFLFTQGFSRPILWRHTMLASLLGVLAVWLPSALLILSGLRSQWQSTLDNPWFPLFAATERPFVLWCLVEYAVLLPVFHYMWIRESQMSRGLASGFLVAGCVVVAGLSIWTAIRVPDMPLWTQCLTAGGMVTAAVSLLIGGRTLYRTMEVTT